MKNENIFTSCRSGSSSSGETGVLYYPYAAPDIRIWLHPHGAVLQRMGPDGFPEPTDRRDLTPLALRCLRLCRGNLTFKDILSQIYREVEGIGFNATQASAEFLLQMLADKILLAADRPCYRPCLEHGSSTRVIPMHLSIELTDYCNLKCLHCYRYSSPASANYLDSVMLMNLMDEAAIMGVEMVELTGGEPTLHPDFIKLVRHAGTRFSIVAVLTNGTTIREDLIDPLCEMKKRLIFQVDLDGANAKQHEGLRGLKGSYQASIYAIRLLASKGFRLRAAMNVYPGNVDSVAQTCHQAMALGATWFGASPVLDVGRSHAGLVLRGKDVLKLHAAIDLLNEQFPDVVIGTKQFQDIKEKSGRNCGAGWRSITVGPDGFLRPCAMFPVGIFSFGTAKSMKCHCNVENADFRYFLELEPPGKTMCGDCPMEAFCRGCFSRPWYAIRRAANLGRPVICHWATKTGFDKIVPGFYSF